MCERATHTRTLKGSILEATQKVRDNLHCFSLFFLCVFLSLSYFPRLTSSCRSLLLVVFGNNKRIPLTPFCFLPLSPSICLLSLSHTRSLSLSSLFHFFPLYFFTHRPSHITHTPTHTHIYTLTQPYTYDNTRRASRHGRESIQHISPSTQSSTVVEYFGTSVHWQWVSLSNVSFRPYYNVVKTSTQQSAQL